MEQALHLRYSDPTNIAGHFISTLERHSRDWDSSTFYAPYLSLVQSSGIGKTRLLSEVAENGVLVVYLNLRSGRESGVPVHIPFSTTFLEWKSELQYARFLFVVLKKIRDSKITPSDLLRQCMTGSFWDKIDKMVNSCSIPLDNVGSECQKVLNEIESQLAKPLLLEPEHDDEQDKSTSSEEPPTLLEMPAKEPERLKVAFAFDEARHLLNDDDDDDAELVALGGRGQSSFAELRRALGKLPNRSGVFAVLTDTFSKVSYLSPAKYLDPSWKVSKSGLKLFPPYYFCSMDLANPLNSSRSIPPDWTCVDVYAAKPTDSIVSYESKAVLKDVGTARHLARFGRPLWISTYLFATKLFRNLSNVEAMLIKLARSKMIGGLDFELWPSAAPDIQLNIFALLMCVYDVAAHVLPQAIETMVASYMCVLGYVSEDRQIVYGKYASEPMLVEGAAQCLQKYGLNKALKQYLQYISLLSAGETGEFIARVILLNSIQSALEESRKQLPMFIYSQKITLQSYLMHLLCRADAETLIGKVPRKLLKGYVCFSHFRRTNDDPDEHLLRSAFSRSMAIICTENATGVDLVIPICLSTDLQTDIKNLEMSALLVQVKNRYSSFSLKETERKLGLDKVDVDVSKGVPYLTMVMSLWQVHKKEFRVNENDGRTHVVVESLDHFKIFSSESKNTRKLKGTCMTIIDHKYSIGQRHAGNSLSQDYVKDMFPTEYVVDYNGFLPHTRYYQQ
jgi:hypothetical protein